MGDNVQVIALEKPRRILHLDMDCFYAAIEMRERPELAGKPVAVGGSGGRGVLTTCNYEARKYGCRSAMPAFKARALCPQLVLLPVRFDLYRRESLRIREIFSRFTGLIEPLSLDEAYLDVSHLETEAASVAWAIRERIREETGLTASAGIAPNKFLAKVASDWNKPDGQFEVRAEEADSFTASLPVEKIWGVGRRTAELLHRSGLSTCGAMRERSEIELVRRFGKFGRSLYRLCRGIDERPVEALRERKSLGNERTFRENLIRLEEGIASLGELVEELKADHEEGHRNREIRECVVKVKFEDFQVTTAQRAAEEIDLAVLGDLLTQAWTRGGGKAVRLIGVAVRFRESEGGEVAQMELF